MERPISRVDRRIVPLIGIPWVAHDRLVQVFKQEFGCYCPARVTVSPFRACSELNRFSGDKVFNNMRAPIFFPAGF
jgi:hypothetical protein